MCWDYIDKIGKNPTKEILVLKLRPSNNDEKDNYQSFFQYLSSRGRFGVVGNCNKNVKDCYIMPLDKTHPVPEALLALSGQGLPVARPDLLLRCWINGSPKPFVEASSCFSLSKFFLSTHCSVG